MSFHNNITAKVELAAKRFLDSVSLQNVSNVYTGITGTDVALPYCVCTCKTADAEEIFDGNWSATLLIHVVSSANDDTLDTHRERAGEVFSWFMTATSPEDLTAAMLGDGGDDFTATTNGVRPVNQSWELITDNGSQLWQSSLTLTVKCCGSVLG